MQIKAVNSKLGYLMTNLIYPAFLGSALVWFLGKVGTQISEHKIDGEGLLKNLFALWLITYFCFTFLLLTRYELKKPYNIVMFLFDIVDVLIIFTGFFGLGFVVTSIDDFSLIYWVIAAIPMIALLSNWYSNGEIKTDLIIAGTILTIPMAIWGHSIYELNWLMLLLLTGLLIAYMVRYHKGITEIVEKPAASDQGFVAPNGQAMKAVLNETAKSSA